MKRIFLIVLDSCGIGAAPDAAAFGDAGTNTLRSCAGDPAFSVPNLLRLGLGNLDGVDYLPKESAPAGAVARLAEASMGKDTTIGHWELAGLVSPRPLPLYPNGFPEEVLAPFRERTGRGTLANAPWSGTEVINVYGDEHVRTGDLIVYTSADSVFQIAAHEDIVPPEQLYEYCRIAREILQGEHGVGRVIARPFVGSGNGNYTRTANRHDFSLMPPKDTLLDALCAAGLDSIGVGKIHDIFAGRGLSEFVYTQGNADGMAKTLEYAKKDFHGLCFVNLVDFDMLYGHRRDIPGYAAALTAFDAWLSDFLPLLGPEDVVMITADHGCDPGYAATTDHTREYIPLVVYGQGITPGSLGTRGSFADIAATCAELLGISFRGDGESFVPQLLKKAVTPEALAELAQEARNRSYCPYSHFAVGAALLCSDGTVYQGCNIENAAFGPSNCAERTAIFKAVSEGRRDFAAIAVAGGPEGQPATELCPPCGVCRQVLREFCPDDFPVYLSMGGTKYRTMTLAELLPASFGPDNL